VAEVQARRPGKPLNLQSLGVVFGTVPPCKAIKAAMPALQLRDAVFGTPGVVLLGHEAVGGHPIIGLAESYRTDVLWQARDVDELHEAALHGALAYFGLLGADARPSRAEARAQKLAKQRPVPAGGSAAAHAALPPAALVPAPVAALARAPPAAAVQPPAAAPAAAPAAVAAAGPAPLFGATLRAALQTLRDERPGTRVDLMRLGDALTLPNCRRVKTALRSTGLSLRATVTATPGITEVGRDTGGGHPLVDVTAAYSADAGMRRRDVASADRDAVSELVHYFSRY
jgi:hypothetical protein